MADRPEEIIWKGTRRKRMDDVTKEEMLELFDTIIGFYRERRVHNLFADEDERVRSIRKLIEKYGGEDE